MLSRSSFYPLPPSTYPKPIVDPCPAYETTYGHEHCTHHPLHDYYRSRTLGDEARASTGLDISSGSRSTIYPQHGTGQFTLPYYRKDSKGFRRPYTQPSHVDQNYLRISDWRRSQQLEQTIQFAHPSSKPGYRAQPTTLGGGVTFNTSYRHQLPYAPRHTSDPHSAELISSTLRRQAAAECSDGSDPQLSVNQVTGELRRPTVRPESGILLDPLLADPIANAYRKPRTVYKRAYGLSQ